MEETYDVVTPHLERAGDKTGRRGAEWRLGLEKKARGDDVDTRWTSTNVEFLTTDELVALRDVIDHALNQVALDEASKLAE